MFVWNEYAQVYWMQDAKHCIKVEKELFEATPNNQDFNYWLNRRGVEVVEVPRVLNFRDIDIDLIG